MNSQERVLINNYYNNVIEGFYNKIFPTKKMITSFREILVHYYTNEVSNKFKEESYSIKRGMIKWVDAESIESFELDILKVIIK